MMKKHEWMRALVKKHECLKEIEKEKEKNRESLALGYGILGSWQLTCTN